MFQEAYYREDCHFREVCYKLPRKLSALQKKIDMSRRVCYQEECYILSGSSKNFIEKHLHCREEKDMFREESISKRLRARNGPEIIADAKKFSFGVSEEE